MTYAPPRPWLAAAPVAAILGLAMPLAFVGTTRASLGLAFAVCMPAGLLAGLCIVLALRETTTWSEAPRSKLEARLKKMGFRTNDGTVFKRPRRSGILSGDVLIEDARAQIQIRGAFKNTVRLRRP